MSITKLAPLAAALAFALQSSAVSSAAKPAFPVTLKTSAGTITLTTRPTRIVSLSSTGTEDLFDVGAGPQVVAVDSQSLLPKNAPHTNLSAFTPNAEAIDQYKPDLVIVGFDQNKIVAQLKVLRIPVLFEPPASNLNDVYAQLNQLGEATGRLPQSEALVTHLRARVAEIVRSVPHGGKPITVYHELDPSYYTATSHTFIASVYKLLGLHDIADAAAKLTNYPKLSPEYIISANPDLIVLADTTCCGESATTVAKRPGWSAINAVTDHQVVAVPDIEASYWGPNIVDFMRIVADHLKTIARAR